MKTLFTLFLFLSSTAYSQVVYKIHMKMERVAMNHYEPTTTDHRTVLIVIEDKFFSIYTGYDTLILKLTKPSDRYDVYKDMLHDEQPYFIIREKVDTGFYLGIIPLPPYIPRKLWSISLMSI